MTPPKDLHCLLHNFSMDYAENTASIVEIYLPNYGIATVSALAP
jgi:hypothetical protein